jgi:putative CocE/NonD family hydrolase
LKSLFLILLSATVAFSQGRGGRGATGAATAAPAASANTGAAFVRENYSKFEYRIPMRDGKKLFTSVYIPKDVFSDGKTYPMIMQRTGYNVQPYGPDKYRAALGPSEVFAREKFIFVYQDIRGRFMSEGEYVLLRPHNPNKGPKDFDEASDTYDTIDWLVKNVPGNTGKIGMWGISQPGFYAAAGMIDAHPALVAVSPQAPVTDYYMGDDVYHNGAFMLNHRFRFYQGFRLREGDPAPPPPAPTPLDWGTPDGYEFFMNMGGLSNADEKYFKGKQPLWNLNIEHPTYDQTWQSRAIWTHLKNIKPAVMLVGGWYDTEDPQGLFRQFDFMEKNSPPATDMLVVGPWNHGGFARGTGDRLGNVTFGSNTGEYYRANIEFPFFMYFLKGKGDGKFPKAYVFQTGVNEWRKFDAWPPKGSTTGTIFLDAKGKLSWKQPAAAAFDEYVADPNKPVPYIGRVVPTTVLNTYMTEDQRFAAARPDVLVYKTEPLDHDVTMFGPITVDLKVSTTGTDSDFVVKVIDVYPGDYPNYDAPAAAPGAPAAPPSTVNANGIPMGGYQQLIRGEPFRGKYRKSFENPVPFEPGKPDRITFKLPDVAHTFREGHSIMVQIQSSWFPLTDRNPQKFMVIPKALSTDFVKATQHVYFGGADGSKIQFSVVQ